MAQRVARPIEEWTQSQLMARAQVLAMYLDPYKLNPPKLRLRKLYWSELWQILREVDTRGLQGKLL